MARKKHALLIGIDSYPHLFEKDLHGTYNDVVSLYGLLREVYGFKQTDITAYLDVDGTSPTRQLMLAAFEALCARVERDDIVVVAYSGHGSRRAVSGGGFVESLVPQDSGRPSPDGDGAPNRDIYDFELAPYLEALRRQTPWLTVIFDCCHAGSVFRDPFVRGVRNISADPRPLPSAPRSADAGRALIRPG
ncbi:MAG: caspase family protein, partial [Acidobacteriota bacterium]